jgi:hypothetical protein
MLLEVAGPLASVFCVLSLCAVFCHAFLVPASDPERVELAEAVSLRD